MHTSPDFGVTPIGVFVEPAWIAGSDRAGTPARNARNSHLGY